MRFGNVLGSSGSVVPIFRRQIAMGGPVTVTDERMTRYFMTIPEAVQLVIRAGSLGQGGEVFVLEMGEPVSIMQLARDMIEFSGLRPDVDIAIDVVGRRPGEKLHEELFNPYERPQPTPAEKITLAEPRRARAGRHRDDVRRDRAARARGRRRRAGGQGVGAVGGPPGDRRRGADVHRTDRPLASSAHDGTRSPPSPSTPRSSSTAPTRASPRSFGLGVLSLLYFAQAREVKRLREWAGRAPERAAELEARVTAEAGRKVASDQPAVATPAAAPAMAAATAAGAMAVTPAAAGARVAAAAGATARLAPAATGAVRAAGATAAVAAGRPSTIVAPAAAPAHGNGAGAAVPPPPAAAPARPNGQPTAPPAPPARPQPAAAGPPRQPGLPAPAAAGAAAAGAAARPAPVKSAPLRMPGQTAGMPRTPAAATAPARAPRAAAARPGAWPRSSAPSSASP